MIRRREFLESIALAGVGASLLSTNGCASDGGSCSPAVNIAENHDHSLTVPADDVEAGEAMTYMTGGDADHEHTVELDADDMETLAGGGIVSVTSGTTEGHSHQITFSCV